MSDSTVKKIPNFLYSLKNERKDIDSASKIKNYKGTIKAYFLEYF